MEADLQVYAWGDNSVGQCFSDELQASYAIPHSVDHLRRRPIGGNACNDSSWMVSEAGVLYVCGDTSALSDKTHPSRTSVPIAHPALDSFAVCAVSSSRDHGVVITAQGVAVSWGSDEFGQLGQGGMAGGTSWHAPRLMRGLRASVIAVGCGEGFTVLLTEEGRLYGTGLHQGNSFTNQQLIPLDKGDAAGIAFRGLSVGNEHCLALSISGGVYSWGSNRHGKLGLSFESNSAESNHTYPVLLPAPFDSACSQVAAGGGHSAVIKRGKVYLFGDNRKLQCGNKSPTPNLPLALPFEAKVREVRLGHEHSLLLVDRLGSQTVLSFGSNSVNQLGRSLNSEIWDIGIVEFPVSANSSCVFLAAGAFHSIAVWENNPEIERTLSTKISHSNSATALSEESHESLPISLSKGSLDRLASKFKMPGLGRPGVAQNISFAGLTVEVLQQLISRDNGDLKRALIRCFADPVLLSSSFLIPGLRKPLLDVSSFVSCCDNLPDSIRQLIHSEITAALCNVIDSVEPEQMSHGDQLRWLVPVLLFVGSLSLRVVLVRIAGFLCAMTPTGRRAFMIMLREQISESIIYERRILSVWRNECEKLISSHGLDSQVDLNSETANVLLGDNLSNILAGLELLSIAGTRPIELSNDKPSDHSFARLDILSHLSEQALAVFVHRELQAWHSVWATEGRLPNSEDWIVGNRLNLLEPGIRTPLPAARTFLAHPGLLPAVFKQRILSLDNRLRQNLAEENLFASNPERIFNLLMQGQRPVGAHVISVRRASLVSDAVNILSQSSPQQLRLPLKVQFIGEDGIDQGGVTKEFFQVLCRDIFSPLFGMFTLGTESRVLWFNPAAALDTETTNMFTIVGKLVGLAVYNNLPGIPAPFPIAIFRRLRHEPMHLEDLAEVFPEEARSMRAIMEWTPDSSGLSFEDTFALDFSVSFDYWGESRNVELIPGGSSVQVSYARRSEFVKLFLEWKLIHSVEPCFNAFSKGFTSVVESKLALEAFNAQDLQQLICGQGGALDFQALRLSAKYEGGFRQDDPYIQSFWQILTSFDDSLKRKFLTFVTGSDRVPLGGLGELKLTLQQNGVEPTDHLPTAYTCFNVMLLPRYATTDKLHRLLITAIENSHGFGLR